MTKPLKKKHPQTTAKAALLFGSGTLTSRILGLIRESLVFSLLPLDMKDAWLAAFRLPNFFRRLLGEGGLSVSFIPIYVSLLEGGKDEERKALANGVFTLLLSLVLLICGLMYVGMDRIVPLWLSGDGFSEVPGKIELTIAMARIMIFFLFFISLFAYFMAVLNSHKRFGFTGYAPLFLNVAIIGGFLAFKDSDKLAMASAWAVVAGGALQALFLLPPIIVLKVAPGISLNPFSKPVRKVLLKFVPTIFGVGVLQILAIVNVYFASEIQGGVSYIYLGDRLLELPLSLIAVSIGTTLLPTLSGYWMNSEFREFTASVSRHLSLFYFLAIPSAVGFWFLGGDIVDVLFKRGEFTQPEVEIVGGILKIYCLTLLAAGSLKILNQALYATGDTLTPAVISCVGLVIHLFMAPVLMEAFQLDGLVLSTALVSLGNFICCLYIVQKRVAQLHWNLIIGNVLSCSTAAGIMGFYLYSVGLWPWKQGGFLKDFPILMAIIAGGGVIYFLLCALFNVSELDMLVKRFRRRS